MKSLIFLSVVLSAAFGISQANETTDGDDFAQPSYDKNRWLVSETPGAHLTQSGDGTLRYVSDSDVSHRISEWRWIGGFPLFTNNWSMQVETHAAIVPDNAYPMYGISLTIRNPYRSYGIGAGPMNAVTLGPDYDYVFLHRDSTNSLLKGFTNRVLALRISWDQITRALSAFYSTNRSADGFNWVLLDTFVLDESWAFATEHSLSSARIRVEDILSSVDEQDNIYIDNFKTEGFAELRLLVQKTIEGMDVIGPHWWSVMNLEFTTGISAVWQPYNDVLFYSPEGWRARIKTTESAFFRIHGALP